MKRITTLSLITLLSLFSTVALGQGRFDNVEVTAEQVKGNVHMLTGFGGNIGVSAGDDGILIIDDQFAPLAEKIAAQLGKLGSDAPRYVINTHYHGDHTGSNAFFHSHKGATVFAHSNVRVRLANDEEVDPEALPTVTYEDGIKLYFNDDVLQVIHLPTGHTDGDSVVWFENTDVLHMGDLFFNGMFPYIDLEAGGSVEGYMESVRFLLDKISDQTLIIPGHGKVSNKSELTAFLEMIEETFAFVKTKKAQGLSVEDVVKAGLDEKWGTWNWNFITTERWITTLYTDA